MAVDTVVVRILPKRKLHLSIISDVVDIPLRFSSRHAYFFRLLFSFITFPCARISVHKSFLFEMPNANGHARLLQRANPLPVSLPPNSLFSTISFPSAPYCVEKRHVEMSEISPGACTCTNGTATHASASPPPSLPSFLPAYSLIADSSAQLIKLRDLVGGMASEKEVIAGLDHPCEPHEQQAVD